MVIILSLATHDQLTSNTELGTFEKTNAFFLTMVKDCWKDILSREEIYVRALFVAKTAKMPLQRYEVAKMQEKAV